MKSISLENPTNFHLYTIYISENPSYIKDQWFEGMQVEYIASPFHDLHSTDEDFLTIQDITDSRVLRILKLLHIDETMNNCYIHFESYFSPNFKPIE